MPEEMHDHFESLMGFTNSEVIDKVKDIKNKSDGTKLPKKVRGGRVVGGDGKRGDGTSSRE